MSFTRGYTRLWLLLAATVLALPGSARAYNAGAPRAEILLPVRLHASLHAHMHHLDGTTWTRAELEQAVRTTILRFNESSPGDSTHFYLDTSTPASTCAFVDLDCFNPPAYPSTSCGISNVLHIVPTYCGSWHYYTVATGGEIIQIQSSINNPAATYGHSYPPGLWSHFEVDLLHELGHAAQLGHPEAMANWSTVCPAGARGCAVMGPFSGPEVEIFSYDDGDGLRAVYGSRDTPIRSHREFVYPSGPWTTWPFNTLDTTGHFSASSAPAGGAVTLVGMYRTLRWPIAYNWDYSTLAVTSLGAANVYQTIGPIAATPVTLAGGTAGRAVVTLSARYTNDSRRWNGRVTVSSRAASGSSSWSTVRSDPASGALADTAVAGISSTLDTVSNQLIHAFRDLSGRVVLQSSNGSTFSTVVSTGLYSMVTPQVSCVPGIIARNCILLLVDPGNPRSSATSQRYQWVEFSWAVSGGVATWNPTSLVTTNILNYGSMSLAAAWNGSAYEYAAIWNVPSVSGGTPYNSYIHMRKPAGSGSFTYVIGPLSSPGASSYGTIGSTGSVLEMYEINRPRTP